MAETPIDERTFTDEEVREILKEAVKKPPSRVLANREGLSLADLKSVGEEVGIDPARLEDAARAVASRKRNQPSRVLGGPTILNFERKVEGEFDPEDTPEILSVIRRTMGQQGEVEEIRSSLEWSAKGDASQTYVTLSPRDGKTTIQASSNLSGVAVLTYLVPGFMAFIPTLVGLVKFIKDGSIPALVVFLTVLPLLYPILRAVYKKISSNESAKLEQVVDELARLTEGAGD